MLANREKIARFFLIIFIFMLIISATFLTLHLDHECEGEECVICYEITVVKTLFDHLIALAIMLFVIKFFTFLIKNSKYFEMFCFNRTPVTLKVKISE